VLPEHTEEASMEKVKDFFDTWVKSQENFREDWIGTAKKLQQTLFGQGSATAGSSAAPGHEFVNIYNSWMAAVVNALKETGDTDVDVIKETLSKAFSSSNAYTKLYEVWLPLFKAIQEKTFSGDVDKDVVDPAKYKEVIDKIFGLSSPEAILEFYDQIAKLMQTFGVSARGFVEPWADAIQKNAKTLPQFAEGRPESLMNIFHNVFAAFDNTFGRIFHVPAVGKDREKVELLLRSFDDISIYLAKNTEYQHRMYVTGLTAMEEVIKTIARKIKDQEEIKNFDEFFDLWLDTNEKAYYALFQTKEFSQMQGELTDASLSVRKHFFKLMELYLYDFPIALRSEMDDLYKTIYDLKKKVKVLEQQIKHLSAQEVAA
jgi:class III poly(R)-hydroxyalkanoic acid synthase PhaE subunit